MLTLPAFPLPEQNTKKEGKKGGLLQVVKETK